MQLIRHHDGLLVIQEPTAAAAAAVVQQWCYNISKMHDRRHLQQQALQLLVCCQADRHSCCIGCLADLQLAWLADRVLRAA
jgi:hypothetical protein